MRQAVTLFVFLVAMLGCDAAEEIVFECEQKATEQLPNLKYKLTFSDLDVRYVDHLNPNNSAINEVVVTLDENQHKVYTVTLKTDHERSNSWVHSTSSKIIGDDLYEHTVFKDNEGNVIFDNDTFTLRAYCLLQ